MAQAVIPAVLQDLIREHKLFQRPEWQRLTDLEKELIEILGRTDLSAGQRARQYAALTKPYIANRDNLLLNGTQFQTKVADQPTNRYKQLKSVAVTTSDVFDNKNLGTLTVAADTSPTITGDENSVTGDDDDAEEGSIDEDTEYDEPPTANVNISSNDDQVFEDAAEDMGDEISLEDSTFSRILDIVNSKDTGKQNLTLEESENLKNLKARIRDFMNVLKAKSFDALDAQHMEDARIIKYLIKSGDRKYYNELRTTYPNIHLVRHVPKTVLATPTKQTLFEENIATAEFDTESLDKLLTAANSKTHDDLGRRSIRLESERSNNPYASYVPGQRTVSTSAVEDPHQNKKRTRYEDDTHDYVPPKASKAAKK
jgi:hypothetical protein